MTELLSNLATPSDAELISCVRGGDLDAYGELFSRHVEAARRLARQLVRGPDADDLVSEAFTKVMGVLRRGGGPDMAFRAYLLTAVRRVHVDRIRSQSRITTTDDLGEFDPGVPFQDTAVDRFESSAAAQAFASLPERWQLVLWHLEVEGQKPAEVAPLLGMSPNSVSALAYRAREGLRQAFLSAHLADTSQSECRWVLEHLSGHVRRGLARRESAKVQEHLDGCRTCTATYLELTEVNANLRALLGPLLLGGLAAGYLGSAGAAGSAAWLLTLLDRAKDLLAGHLVPAGGTAASGVAATSVAMATAVALSVSGTPAHFAGRNQAAPPLVTSEVRVVPQGTASDGRDYAADTGVGGMAGVFAPAPPTASDPTGWRDGGGFAALFGGIGVALLDSPGPVAPGGVALLDPGLPVPPPVPIAPGATDPSTIDPGTTDPGAGDPGTGDPSTDPGTDPSTDGTGAGTGTGTDAPTTDGAGAGDPSTDGTGTDGTGTDGTTPVPTDGTTDGSTDGTTGATDGTTGGTDGGGAGGSGTDGTSGGSTGSGTDGGTSGSGGGSGGGTGTDGGAGGSGGGATDGSGSGAGGAGGATDGGGTSGQDPVTESGTGSSSATPMSSPAHHGHQPRHSQEHGKGHGKGHSKGHAYGQHTNWHVKTPGHLGHRSRGHRSR